MKNEIVKINASDFGLDETKAQEITKGLTTILTEREVLQEEYNKCITLEILPENISLFKDLRLRIRDNRTKGIEVWHKNNKAYFLAGGNFVDAIKRKEVAENERMEERLLDAEKFFENQERERVEKLRTERAELLKPYTEIEPIGLGNMEQSVFDNYLTGVKLAYEKRIADEKKAEEERIENEKKQKVYDSRTSFIAGKKNSWYTQFKTDLVVKLTKDTADDEWNNILKDIETKEFEFAKEAEENKKEADRLKKEKDDKEAEEKKKATIEKAKVDKYIAELVRIGYAKQSDHIYSLGGYTVSTDILKSLSDIEFKTRIKEVNDNIIRDKQLKEIEDKKIAEEKRKKAEEKKAKLAPDKTKLLNFMQAINDLPRPEVKSIEAANIAANANALLIKVANYIRDNADKL